MHRLAVLSLALLLVAACGSDDGSSDDSTSTTSSLVETTTTAAPTTLAAVTTTDAPSTTGATTTTEATTTTHAALPGEPIEIGPLAGDVLAVMGVAHDDVLNVRAGPGTDQVIVAELDPLEEDVLALGKSRALSRSIWIEVEVEGTTGWANLRYLVYKAGTDDLTSRVVSQLGGIPTAPTMEELGELVAETFAVAEPEGSSIVMSVAPTAGDLGEVTFDVAGLADDSLWGFRLHVFGAPVDGGGGFSLKSVEATTFCSRGVVDDLCV